MKSKLFTPPESPYLVPYDGSFRIADAPTEPPKGAPSEDEAEKQLEELTDKLADRQRKLFADDRYAILLVFQAMDAGGKDSTIRAVMSGINPAGFQVSDFKTPSTEELDHDFLWRVNRALPERGRIGIFNRSHYEEVLVVRVHPQYLDKQKLPRRLKPKKLWKERQRSIRDFEKHQARNGMVIVKFFLNVSRDQQKRRFLRRIERPDKHWKFNPADVHERHHWDEYMVAYEDALNATSRPWAPWYAIPADDKPFMRLTVARIFLDVLESIDLRWPDPSEDDMSLMRKLGDELKAEDG